MHSYETSIDHCSPTMMTETRQTPTVYNCRASKGNHTPPLSKVDQLYKEHHSNFIVVGD